MSYFLIRLLANLHLDSKHYIELTVCKTSLRVIRIALIRVLTLSYYRLYQFNTIHPIQRLAALTEQTQNTKTILYFIRQWRVRKLAELQFVSIAVSPSRA